MVAKLPVSRYSKSMRKAIPLVAVLFLLLIVAGYFFVLAPKSVGRINITSTPKASIFLNEKLIGKTPYFQNQKPGDYTLKLIPDDTSSQASSWEGQVSIKPGFETYVKRDLGESEVGSGGEIVSIEKIEGNETQLSVSTSPDAVTVLLDGQERGVAPQLLRSVAVGEHDITLTLPGYITRTIRTKTDIGYKVSVLAQLALSPDAPAPASSSGSSAATSTSTSTSSTPKVVIKDTPTGFLRVRSSPSLTASETAQIKPGESYDFLEEKDGWYHISLNGKDGWIAARYADKSK
jgi:hypothetical protein